jgi:phosphate:Na+ symporter
VLISIASTTFAAQAAGADPVDGRGLLDAILRASGAVGVFLLGMVLMTDGLKQLAGPTLRELIGRVVGRPIAAVATGAGLTVAMQASSSTVLATMGFASSGMLTLRQAVPVVAGATIGTTSTSWLMATIGLKASISAFAAPLVLVGALMRMLRRGRTAQIGSIVAGFGMLIVGIGVLKLALGPVVAHVRLDAIDGGTLLGTLGLVGIGCVLAVLMQSSAAPVAIAMAALAQGAMHFDQAAPLVVGATVGTTSTALLALPGVAPPGRRVALLWIVNSVASASIALVLLPFLEAPSFGLTRFVSEHDPVALAAFHTTFALIGAMVVVWVAGPVSQRLEQLIPDRGPRLTAFLDSSFASVPAIAIEAARRSLAATSREVLVAAARQLRDGTHAGEERLAMIRMADDAIEAYILGVRRDALGTHDAERVVATLQALSHVRELRRMLKRRELRPPTEESQRARALRTRIVETTETVIHWIDADGPSPVLEAERLAADASTARAEIRSEILRRVADGAMSAELADSAIDGLRALDEYARDVHRLAANLDLGRRSAHTNPE